MDIEKKSLIDKITDKRIQLEKYLDKNLPKINPTGIEAKRNNLLIASSAITLLVGLYTYVMPKNLLYTILRSGVHFTGAFAFPAGGALASSLVMHGIEGIANLGINEYNKRHPENQKEPFKINPKVKNAIQFLSSAAVGIAYAHVTLRL